jgi:ubiquinone/menaquinone biosynthesis C-methylase UbiE
MSAMQWGTAADFPAVYEELMVPGFFEAFAEELLDRAQPAAGERMLDVATGTGIVLRRARARAAELTRLVGLDLTAGMLDVAREKSAGLDVEFVVGDATALPFEDGSFDLVSCQQGLQFFPERERALAEFLRVLAPGGRVVVACWCEIETAPANHAVAETVARHLPDSERVARAPFSFPDADALHSLLAGAGFGSVEVERVDGVARFSSPEEFARSFLEGSPMAVAMAEVPQERRDALSRDIAATVRERIGHPVAAAMATNIATARV